MQPGAIGTVTLAGVDWEVGSTPVGDDTQRPHEVDRILYFQQVRRPTSTMTGPRISRKGRDGGESSRSRS